MCQQGISLMNIGAEIYTHSKWHFNGVGTCSKQILSWRGFPMSWPSTNACGMLWHKTHHSNSNIFPFYSDLFLRRSTTQAKWDSKLSGQLPVQIPLRRPNSLAHTHSLYKSCTCFFFFSLCMVKKKQNHNLSLCNDITTKIKGPQILENWLDQCFPKNNECF